VADLEENYKNYFMGATSGKGLCVGGRQLQMVAQPFGWKVKPFLPGSSLYIHSFLQMNAVFYKRRKSLPYPARQLFFQAAYFPDTIVEPNCSKSA
jgi:hypothetical protein